MSTSSCRNCRERIRFIRTANGKMLPIDADQNSDGNVAVMVDAAGVWIGRVLTKDEAPSPGERVYMPHFATCQWIKTENERKAQTVPAQRAPTDAELAGGGVAVLTPKGLRGRG